MLTTLAWPGLGGRSLSSKKEFVCPACTLWRYKTCMCGSVQIKRVCFGEWVWPKSWICQGYFNVQQSRYRVQWVCSLCAAQTMMYLICFLHSLAYCVLCYRARVNKPINSGLCNLVLCHQSSTVGLSTTSSAVDPKECTIDCQNRSLYIKIWNLSAMPGFFNAELRDSDLVIWALS